MYMYIYMEIGICHYTTLFTILFWTYCMHKSLVTKIWKILQCSFQEINVLFLRHPQIPNLPSHSWSLMIIWGSKHLLIRY